MKAIEEILQQLYDNVMNPKEALTQIKRNSTSIENAALLIKALPQSQAIQNMKSKLSNQPYTAEINGSLRVIYLND